MTQTDKALFDEMIAFCKKYNIISFLVFGNYCLRMRPTWHDFLADNAVAFVDYFNAINPQLDLDDFEG